MPGDGPPPDAVFFRPDEGRVKGKQFTYRQRRPGSAIYPLILLNSSE
ncbi:hypothetical protein OPIT5_25175 [Opitutaceae bacterium TAV5]|nr:hypothetical protein OPIT5_25175 [Opitutaceae bacterium TAV5]